MVPKMLDAIYEEIKREDFLLLLKRFLPALIGLICLTLGIAGFYGWKKHSYENHLVQDEKTYKIAQNLHKKGDVPGAIALLDTLIKQSKGLKFVSLCTKAAYEREEFLQAKMAAYLRKTPKSPPEALENYQSFWSIYETLSQSYPSPAFNMFLLFCKGFLQVEFPDARLGVAFDEQSVWYLSDLMWRALHAYVTKEKIISAFALWSKVAREMGNSGFRESFWLADQATKGCVVGFFSESSPAPQQPPSKTVRRHRRRR